MCVLAHTRGKHVASESRTFSARASLTKGRVPPLNEVDWVRSGSDTTNSEMKKWKGVVRVADSEGLPNEARIVLLKQHSIKHDKHYIQQRGGARRWGKDSFLPPTGGVFALLSRNSIGSFGRK